MDWWRILADVGSLALVPAAYFMWRLERRVYVVELMLAMYIAENGRQLPPSLRKFADIVQPWEGRD
jgi:hypothetical protein